MFNSKYTSISVLILSILLSLSGCAGVQTVKAEPETGEIRVSNIDELLSAIGPDCVIRMAPGLYNITEAEGYGKNSADSTYYSWINYGFEGQYGLLISGADNMTIIGDGAEIVTEPRSANVLSFENSDNLSISDLKAGHTEAAAACEGGVISLNRCDNASLERCSLYGCGTMGIEACESRNLSVTDTSIYHCSSSGVYAYGSTGLSVSGCSIYDCGAVETGSEAVGAIVTYGCRDVNVDNCDIHNNYFSSLIQSDETDNLTVSGIRVKSNRISSAFNCSGELKCFNLSFRDNSIDRWIGAYADCKVSVDGNVCDSDALSLKWPDQLSSTGVGTVEAEYRTVDYSGTEEVHVKTIDELLNAIASDTHICIDVPRLTLTDASDYPETAGEEWEPLSFDGNSYVWNYVYDGYQLCIGNLSNLHISGGEIVTEPRYANVLGFYNCSDISICNISLGHTPEQGACCGGVLYFENTENIIIDTCDLYGCGILGIQTEHVKSLSIQNTQIHHCNQGAAWLENSSEVTFLGCNVRNCASPQLQLQNCTEFSWDRRLMDPYSSFDVSDETNYEYAKTEGLTFVNLRGDEIVVYPLSDDTYTDDNGAIYRFDGLDSWLDEDGVQWNEKVS